MKKKTYKKPLVEVLELDVKDILTKSPDGTGESDFGDLFDENGNPKF